LLAQFLGAANDNAFKVTLSLFILASVTGQSAQMRLASVATLLFPIPFLLFSPLAGYLADRFSKGRLLPVIKAPEIAAMGLSIVALSSGHLWFLMVVLFLMSTQSAFFSPVKYGLLPEAVEDRDLSMANGILQMTTNLAILVGSLAGALVFTRFRSEPQRAGWIFLAAAVVGTLAALYVPRTPRGSRPARFLWNPFQTAVRDWREARRIPVLLEVMFGIAFFGFIGALFLTIIPVYGKNVLGLSEGGAGLLLMVLSIGIGAGSILAGKLSKGRVELGLVPIGSIGLSLASLDLALFGQRMTGGFPLRAVIDLALVGLAAGLYVVPLNALLQQRSPDGKKGRMIAFSNVMTFGFVLLAALLGFVSAVAGLGPRQVVLIVALAGAASTVYIVGLMPAVLVRLVLWLTVHGFYRLQSRGEENIPREGALLVANHVSWVDALLIAAACDRMIRFLIFRPYYEAKALNWFFRRMHVIPVAAGDAPELKQQSLELAREQIRQGHVVCIFAEGAITRTGNLLKFKRGFEQIAEGTDAPIVPVLLDGVWGSVFSWESGRLLFKWPRRGASRVRVIFGKPLPPSSTSYEVRGKIQELSVEAFRLREPRQLPLAGEFVNTAKRFWRRPFLADSEERRLRFGEALVAALGLRDRLLGGCGSRREPIGILLPAGIDGAVSNLAVVCAGRVLLNLAASSSWAEIRAQVDSAGASHILTSRAYLARLGLEERDTPCELLLLDDEAAALPATRRLVLWAACRFLPPAVARRVLLPRDSADSVAVLAQAWPAGPAGESRWAELTHRNILSNLESLKQVFRVSREDRILGVLPFSSPFGLTGTLFLPAIAGIRVAYHEDPLDSATVGRLAREYRLTLVPASPSQLELYNREVAPDRLRWLRHVVVAGGTLSEELRVEFLERFGVEPLAGYGRAECAPLVSLNVPLHVRDGRGQAGHRPGTSGHPLPGIAIRIVDGDDRALPPEEMGRLLVKGTNVMRGYHDDPELTAQVLHDGWFDTREQARQDADGFLTVLDGSTANS